MRRTRRRLRDGLALGAISWMIASPALAGEGLERLSNLMRRPAEPAGEKARPLSGSMNWWAIPRPARAAAKNLAKSQDAKVTRCVAIENEDRVAYEIHASKRLGLFKKSDFVLTTVTEPKATAEKRKEQQSFKGRVARLREAAQPKPPSRIGNDNGYVLPESK